MIAVTLGQAFCWFHEAPGDVGVVICPGIGRDFRHAYRTMHLLADMLSEADYPVLRISYSNTGNSGDDLSEPFFETCSKNVKDAIAWMAGHGISRLVLCGFRFGALLVSDLQDQRIVGSVLIQPVVSGKKLLREMRAMNALQDLPNGGRDGVWENEDVVLRRVDQDSLAARSASNALLRGANNLIIADEFAAGSPLCCEGDVGGAGPGRFVRSSLYDALMEPFENSTIPHRELGEVRDWLKKTVRISSHRPQTAALVPAILEGAAWREQAVELASHPAVRGMLCEPAGRALPSEKAVVIGNLGWDPQFGMGRFNAELARRLAAQGITVLRIDYLGVGDSGNLPENEKNLIYATSRAREFRAAIDWLQARGFAEIGLAGHCSGAFEAFRAALRDDRVRFAVLVNIVCFAWTFPGGYADYLGSRRKRLDDWFRHGMRAIRYFPARLFPYRPLRELTRRGVKVWFISGDRDLSRRDTQHLFPSKASRKPGWVDPKLIDVPDTDHVLSTSAMRRRVVEAIAAELGDSATCESDPLRSRIS